MISTTTRQTDFGYLLDDAPAGVIGRDKVTILKCLHGVAQKVFLADRVKTYRAGKYFDLRESSVNNINDLAELLDSLRTHPKEFIVRGRPFGTSRTHVLRRSRGEDATLRDEPIHWMCIDVDGVGTVTGPPAAELRDLIESAPQLRGITCVAQISSSWGIKPGIHAHLWYYLEEPRSSNQVSEWASSLPFNVDHGLYNPVQPHYTADPVFDGVPDPLEGAPRVFVLTGTSDTLYVPAGTAEAEADYWVTRIENLEDDDARHPVVNKAAYSLGGWVGAGSIGKEDAIDRLLTACITSGVFNDGRLEDVKGEIERGIEDGAKRPRQCEDWKHTLIRNKDGDIKPLPENYVRIFKIHPVMEGVLGYDVRKEEPIFIRRPPWELREGGSYPRGLRDADDVEACAWFNRLGIHTSSVTQVSGALTAAAEAHPYDPVVDWVESLPPWDRQERLFRWLPKTTGCEDTIYSRAVGAKFIISMIARAMDPGCKAEDMLVLIGPQGGLKSTLLAAVAGGPGQWAFSDCLGDIRKPADYIPTIMGPWMIEVAELSAFSKKEVEAVKKFLSTETDRSRLSYGRRAVGIPRRCVFAGTSNTTDFLTDLTGNRRFHPIDCVKIDIQGFLNDRAQIFAEAVYHYGIGTPWYLEGEEVTLAMREQEGHRVIDPWEDEIRDYLDVPAVIGSVEDLVNDAPRRDQVSAQEILSQCLRIPAVQASSMHSRRVAAIFRRLGWARVRIHLGENKRLWVYRRPVEVLSADNHE